MLELRAAMPDLRLTPYPVKSEEVDADHWWRTRDSARRMVIEYCKYLAILTREAVLSLGPRDHGARRRTPRQRRETSRGAGMIWLRSLLFVAVFYLWTAIVAIAMLPTLVLPRAACAWALRVWGASVTCLLRVICGVRVEVRGRQHLPTGAALIAPKHQCMFDIFGAFAFLPDTCFVLRKELMLHPLLRLVRLEGRHDRGRPRGPGQGAARSWSPTAATG